MHCVIVPFKIQYRRIVFVTNITNNRGGIVDETDVLSEVAGVAVDTTACVTSNRCHTIGKSFTSGNGTGLQKFFTI